MPNSDPLPTEPLQPPARPVWGIVTVLAAGWLVVCAVAFALMMGWI